MLSMLLRRKSKLLSLETVDIIFQLVGKDPKQPEYDHSLSLPTIALCTGG